MKLKTKKLFLKEFSELNNLKDEDIVKFLKKNNDYNEDFFDLDKEELLNFIKLNINKVEKRVDMVKDKEEKKVKEEDLYLIYSINSTSNNLTTKIRNYIKKNVSMNEENIEDISKNFCFKRRNIDNYNDIDLYDLFDFSFFFVNDEIDYINHSSKEDVSRLFIKIKNDVVYISIFDIISILFNKEYFKDQVLYLNQIFNWEDFSNKYQEFNKNKNIENMKFLDSEYSFHIDKYKEALKTLIIFENNVFDELNRTKDGDHYFFISKSKMSELIGKSETTTNSYINFMTMLGFIEKVSYDDISTESDIRINKNNQFNKVNILKINNFYDVKEFIDYNSSFVLRNKITDKKLTKNNLIKSGFNDIAERVFPNSI